MKENLKNLSEQSRTGQKKADGQLTMHKLVGEHEWESCWIPEQATFLNRCRICGELGSEHFEQYPFAGTTYITSSGSNLSLKELSTVFDTTSQPDVLLVSPSQKLVLDKLFFDEQDKDIKTGGDYVKTSE